MLGYLLLFKQFEQYRAESSELEEIYELGTLLRDDIYRAEFMKKEGESLLLIFPSHQFQYIFNDNNILRYSPWRKDTFNIALNNYKMQFAGEEVYSDKEVDGLQLTFQNNEIELNAFYQKEYTADVLMKLEMK